MLYGVMLLSVNFPAVSELVFELHSLYSSLPTVASRSACWLCHSVWHKTDTPSLSTEQLCRLYPDRAGSEKKKTRKVDLIVF